MKFNIDKITDKQTYVKIENQEQLDTLGNWIKKNVPNDLDKGMFFQKAFPAYICFGDCNGKYIWAWSGSNGWNHDGWKYINYEDLIEYEGNYMIYDIRHTSIVDMDNGSTLKGTLVYTDRKDGVAKIKVGEYSETWCNFRTMTSDEKEEYKEHILAYEKDKENKMKTEYIAIKTISGKNVIDAGACEDESEKFVKQFGYRSEVQWNKENEDWIRKNIVGGIKWLIDYKFIKENNKIVFNPNKIYCCQIDNRHIYKLAIAGYNKYNFVCFGNRYSMPWETDTFNSPQSCLDDAIEKENKVYTFDNEIEMIKHFYGNKL